MIFEDCGNVYSTAGFVQATDVCEVLADNPSKISKREPNWYRFLACLSKPGLNLSGSMTSCRRCLDFCISYRGTTLLIAEEHSDLDSILFYHSIRQIKIEFFLLFVL